MTKVLNIFASGVAALGTPWISHQYAKQSRTPFADDRQKLRKDYENICQDIRKSIDRVKEQNVSKTHCP